MIRRIPVAARNNIAVIAPIHFTVFGTCMKKLASIGNRNAPAAIAFVQMYAETSHPHNTPLFGAS